MVPSMSDLLELSLGEASSRLEYGLPHFLGPFAHNSPKGC